MASNVDAHGNEMIDIDAIVAVMNERAEKACRKLTEVEILAILDEIPCGVVLEESGISAEGLERVRADVRSMLERVNEPIYPAMLESLRRNIATYFSSLLVSSTS